MLRYLLLTTLAAAPLAVLAQRPAVPQEVKTEIPAAQKTALFTETGAIANPTVPVTPVAQVKQTLGRPNVVLLDVRTPEEYATGHLPGAGNLNFRAPDVAAQLQQLDPNKTYVVYCASGNRSNKTAVLMQEKGFKHVVNAGAYQDLKNDIK
ncbi:rhodanese-like domain-containing protein [Hymenobacter rubripertinctus]|uniref:Rhodanese-like domain-containing protein n=1 Tax=Hymenobacter rubripertinctus TaxID=2029981 RepID=A0A418QMA5_9BACT|nr:rhodanese-like domain-containing protein [Hymenobacter rubripertinctus]RIY06239.1 rhodanese-like domain-containing protein [Hymenobacter rubripertinctus]